MTAPRSCACGQEARLVRDPEMGTICQTCGKPWRRDRDRETWEAIRRGNLRALLVGGGK